MKYIVGKSQYSDGVMEDTDGCNVQACMSCSLQFFCLKLCMVDLYSFQSVLKPFNI